MYVLDITNALAVYLMPYSTRENFLGTKIVTLTKKFQTEKAVQIQRRQISLSLSTDFRF